MHAVVDVTTDNLSSTMTIPAVLKPGEYVRYVSSALPTYETNFDGKQLIRHEM